MKKIAALFLMTLSLFAEQCLALQVPVEVPYAVAMPTTFEATPGSTVTIPLRITNNGSGNLVFDCSIARFFNGGPDCIGLRPSVGGGGPGVFLEGQAPEPFDWTLIDFTPGPTANSNDVVDQFNVTIPPGGTADFVFGRFVAGEFGRAVNLLDFSVAQPDGTFVHFFSTLRVTVGDQDITGPFVTLPATVYVAEPATALLVALGGVLAAGLTARRRRRPDIDTRSQLFAAPGISGCPCFST